MPVRHLIRDNATLLVQYALSSLLPLLLVPYFVRDLGLVAFGSVAIALGLANIAAVLVQFGFPISAPARLVAPMPGETPRAVFDDVLGVKLVLSLGILAVLVAGNVIYGLAGGRALEHVQLVAVLFVVAGAAFNSAWLLQVRGRFLAVMLVSAAGTCIALLAAFGVRWPAGWDARWPAVVALTIGSLWTGLLTWWIAHRAIGARPERVRWMPWSRLKGLLREGSVLAGSQLAATMYASLGPLVVGAVSDVRQAGAYAAVERPVGALAAAANLTHVAAYPRLVRLYGDDRRRYRQLWIAVVLAYLVFAAATTVLAMAFAPWVTRYLFGGDTDVPFGLVAMALVWFVLSAAGAPLTGYLVTSGRHRDVMRITIVTLGIAVGLGWVGAWQWGAAGWMGALAAAQLYVVHQFFKAWQLESRLA